MTHERPPPQTANPSVPSPGGWQGWIGPLLVMAAFAAGLATDALSAGRQVNLLAAPMLGLLAWNLAVYLALAGSRLATLAGRAPRPPGPIPRALLRIGRASPRPGLGGQADAARATAALHAASAALAAGILTGLYLRGLAFEYRAGWESTFLDAEAARWLLGLVLGPASALTGIALPDADALARLRFDAGTGERAARWIHLYAVTVVLGVILPRMLLAAWAGHRARRLARTRSPAATGTIASPSRGAGAASGATGDESGLAGVRTGPDGTLRIFALPYSFALPQASASGLERLLAGALGPGVQITLAPSLSPQAAEAPGRHLAQLWEQPPGLILVLFNLVATPEPQTHAALVQWLASRCPAGATLRVLVDETAFRERFGALPARLAQRRQAWRALFEDIGIRPGFATLGAQAGEAGR